MANFGKKAKLDCQKSTVKVECLVSVYDRSIDPETGAERYRVVVQRLQDQVREDQARAGMADALPFITNRKHWCHQPDGSLKVEYSHDDYVSGDMMNAIRKAALNCRTTRMTVETAPGVFEEKDVENYCVLLDIGFNLAKGEAFFYRIKSGVNKDSLAKDIKYNLRHMPASGRTLTQAILDGHREITDIAVKVMQDAASIGSGDGKIKDNKPI